MPVSRYYYQIIEGKKLWKDLESYFSTILEDGPIMNDDFVEIVVDGTGEFFHNREDIDLYADCLISHLPTEFFGPSYEDVKRKVVSIILRNTLPKKIL